MRSHAWVEWQGLRDLADFIIGKAKFAENAGTLTSSPISENHGCEACQLIGIKIAKEHRLQGMEHTGEAFSASPCVSTCNWKTVRYGQHTQA